MFMLSTFVMTVYFKDPIRTFYNRLSSHYISSFYIPVCALLSLIDLQRSSLKFLVKTEFQVAF